MTIQHISTAEGFVLEGNSLSILKEIIAEGLTVQSIVCDPPYGISFMGRYWDNTDNIAFHPEIWRLCFDLLAPGGHLVAFGGTRTYHRLVCAVEDASFEIRDQLAWVYGTGFPKSMDVSKAIDKAAGAERMIIGEHHRHGGGNAKSGSMSGPLGTASVLPLTAPATKEALQWQGWGTALKPAWEPIVLARKPLIGTVAENVLDHTTGGLNIDACRVETKENLNGGAYAKSGKREPMNGDERDGAALGMFQAGKTVGRDFAQPLGRFPANIIHDGSQEVLEIFEGFGERGGGDQRGNCEGRRPGGFGDVGHDNGDGEPNGTVYSDSGSAARFFYCAKASKKERDGSKHPTVKPLALMRWLIRLVTPPGGIVLDPFAGTGTTGEAAYQEGFSSILIEREPEYVRDIERRLSKYRAKCA